LEANLCAHIQLFSSLALLEFSSSLHIRVLLQGFEMVMCLKAAAFLHDSTKKDNMFCFHYALCVHKPLLTNCIHIRKVSSYSHIVDNQELAMTQYHLSHL
jgi:hypothetical protein